MSSSYGGWMFLRARRASMTAALMTIGLLLTTAGAVGLPVSPTRAAEPERKLTAEQKASQQARETGEPVAVPELRDETTDVVANPDGTFTAEIHSGPVRYRAADGDWADVDLTLAKRADGTVAPKGHPRGLVLSGKAGAGDHDLARLSSDGAGMTVGWSGALPDPELDGTTATYREVRPGVDLVIDATRTGFEQYLIVQNRDAASQVTTISLPWRTTGVIPSLQPDGGLRLTDAKRGYLGHMPAPVMWDATIGEVSGEHLRSAPVEMAVTDSGSVLKLTPSPSFLSDPATRYPVTIDPSATLKPGFDTLVQNNIGSDLSTSKELKLGSVTEGATYRARSFIRFPVSATAHKRVTAATLYLWNTHSWNCNPQEWQVWITSAVGTSTRWDNQPSWHSDYPIAKSTMTKGYTGCTTGYVTANVQPLFQKASDLGYTALTTGLRSTQAGEDNPDNHAWKKFDSTEATHDPYVSITYNTKPNPPTDLSIGGKKCGNSDAAAYVSKAAGNPSAQARADDPDGTERTLTMQFLLLKWGTAIPATPTMSKATTDGAIATVAVPQSFGLTENQKYTMYARVFDGLEYSANSAGCTFTIDSTGPAKPPTVTSSDYPLCTPDSCDTHGGVGVSGRFTMGANGITDIKQYRYWFDGSSTITTAAPSLGGSVTVGITPPAPQTASTLRALKIAGVRELHVVSIDQAGRESAEFAVGTGDDAVGGYKFNVASGPDPTGWWKLDEPPGSTQFADAGTGNHPMTATTGGWTPVGGNGDGGNGVSYNTSGSAQSALAVNLGGNRTTMASARLSAASAAELTIVRHVAYGSPYRQDDLYFDGATQKVCYRVRVTNSGEWKACSGRTIRAGNWVHAAGMFDVMRGEVAVYLDGDRTASTAVTAYTTTVSGTGGFTAIANRNLAGALDDIKVWNRLLAPQEVGAASVAEAGYWDFDFWDGTDTSTHPVHHDVSAPNPPDDLWSDVGYKMSDLSSAQLDGKTALTTSGPALNTAESFSVSVWMRLNALPTTNHTAVSQDGANQSSFYLGARNFSGVPRWSFTMASADATSGVTFTHAATVVINDDDIGEFVHLVGVYDAATQQQTLYVDGVAGTPVAQSARWNATGPFAIGRGKFAPSGGTGAEAEFVGGGVDEIRVYAGALTPDMVLRLNHTEDGIL